MATEQGLKNLAEILPLLKLSSDGQKIVNCNDFECSNGAVKWNRPKGFDISELIFDMSHGYYTLRLKPQPEYVPFENWDEVFGNTYIPGLIWVKNNEDVYMMSCLNDNSSFASYFKNCVFYNPLTKETKPFGKLKTTEGK